MKRSLIAILLLSAATGAAAQTVSVEGDAPEALTTQFSPLGNGFYQLACVSGYRQDLLPVYLEDTVGVVLPLRFSSQVPQVMSDAANRALSATYAAACQWQRSLFLQPADRPLLASQLTERVDSIVGACQPCEPVRRYIGLWTMALTGNFDACRLDDPLATLFPEAVEAIVGRLGQGSLEQRLDSLYAGYNDAQVRAKVADVLLTDYTSRYRFDSVEAYEQGLAQLESVSSRFGLDVRYAEAFRLRRASVVGTPFPESVVLRDEQGRPFDFSSLRGRYVYIDLWASWCVPCIREMPALQRLEEQFSDRQQDVVFLSVSIDTKTQAWLKKKQELQPGGLQLIDTENALPRALNVKGIPFFVIYDRDGRLHTYNAPRPSHPQLPALLRQLP